MDDDAFFREPDGASNSLAILVKHMGGNLRSRWTDFLTSDGEKPDRHRDTEFELGPDDDRAELMRRWEAGWDLVYEELDRLDDDDLTRTVYIRSQPSSARAAILRQLGHAAYHAGQIVLLARMYAGEWQSLSIPPGESEAFNARMRERARREAGS